MKANNIQKLKQWFLSQARDLPWRINPTPYAVWVSEVMLQQTRVNVVISYFERWMQRFPNIQALAEAPIETVLKEWEGLGYYSRARNLHAGARYVVANHNGILPNSESLLKPIKGLGNYTIGAILSFAFHQRTAAVDGNVLRVLSRYYGLTDDISKQKTINKIHNLATELLPENEPWIISEALIELGATTCGRQPKCGECPLNSSCIAFKNRQTDQIPVKSNQVAVTNLYRAVAVISCHDHLLVRKGEKGKVMADLYEFPYFELPSSTQDMKLLKKNLFQSFNLQPAWKETLPTVKHSFTRYQALLLPEHFTSQHMPPVTGFDWLTINALKQMPFSSGHRRIFESHFLQFGHR